VTEVPGLVLPTWESVRQRDYQAWDRPHRVLDTAALSAEACVAVVLADLATGG
jgi:hypothetical protein